MSTKTVIRLFNDDNNQPINRAEARTVVFCPKTASGKHIWQPFALSHNDEVYERCIACGLFNF